MLIDIHTHAFPEKIAERAIETLSHTSGGLIPQHKGTLASLKEEMAKDGVDISVVLGIATNPQQQTNVNNFAAEINKDEKIIAFGSVHPDAPDALQELERIKALGLKGVKLHPEYQNFYVDDERMKPIYKKISQLGLITLFHAGHDYGYGNMPKSFAQEIVDKHTPDMLLFGSDMPWHRPSWKVRLIETLDIASQDKEKIYYKNAMKLLGL